MKKLVTLSALVFALSAVGSVSLACPHADKAAAKKTCTDKGLKAGSPEFKACLKETHAATCTEEGCKKESCKEGKECGCKEKHG
ncbi:MAG: hypothetical protein SGI74_08350 [Oligoflexia bacterium]|nr:hypothetical protein [Oligoflexia bacterium]